MVTQQLEDRVGNRADPGLNRRSIRNTIGHESRDVAILGRHPRHGHFDERIIGLGPADDLAQVQRVLPEGARHLRVDLDEEGKLSDEARRVVGVGSERDVAVRIGR